jgi:hygromycin-B 7''-O-kinase
MHPVLADVTDEAAFDALMADAPAKRAVLDALGDHLDRVLQAPPDGSAIVGLDAEVVVKVMAPFDRAHHDVEVAALQALHGRLPVATPEVLDVFDWHGWPGFVMRRLPGVQLSSLQDRLDPDTHPSIADQLGEVLAALHALPAPPAIPRADWSAWCAERIPAFAATQRRRGTPEPLVASLAAWLPTAPAHAGPAAWLHTEVMPAHLMVTEAAGRARITGLFDFEPSWVGPVDYEFASVGVFFSAGDAGLLGRVLRAAGREVSPERLLAMACLHRYANLGWYHRQLGGPLDDPAALAAQWFGVV